ncbi:MAG TPA: helical backbone metal receptor, partial [Saprospiraceae bacterium]|nr:helical backbone metal receptor [Saprospiraceae bacterium]
PEGIQQLQQHYPVWMSDIVTLEDAYSMIKEIGRITNRSNEAGMMCDEILRRFNSLQPLRKAYRAAYFIWRHPYMVASRETFIHEMLMKLGVENVFGHLSRYPEIELEKIAEQKPDLIFLSSEPYPFGEKHFEEFASRIPNAKIMIVDGQYFSWYGSRLLQAPEYLEGLKNQF